MNVKECIAGNATFLCYRNSMLWYTCANGFEVPIPITDVGDTTFNKVEKGIMLMRWIRKHLALIDSAELDTSV